MFNRIVKSNKLFIEEIELFLTDLFLPYKFIPVIRKDYTLQQYNDISKAEKNRLIS